MPRTKARQASIPEVEQAKGSQSSLMPFFPLMIEAANEQCITVGGDASVRDGETRKETKECKEKNNAKTVGMAVMASGTGSVGDMEGGKGAKTAIVKAAQERASALEGKMAFRSNSAIAGLLPYGGGALELKVPKRKDFGPEGKEGDEQHQAAMKFFSLKEFGTSHVQERTILARFGCVGLFGDWLEQNVYGAFVEWRIGSEPSAATSRVAVPVERDGAPRIPSEAAVMEYIMAMATGDSESRPKGGRPEYRRGVQEKTGGLGKRMGS